MRVPRTGFLRTISLALIVAMLAMLVVACDGNGDDNGDADNGDGGPRPPGVPESAQLVTEDFTIGDPGAADGNADASLFFSAACTDDVLGVVTTDATIYAELPCDRALPPETAERFLGKSTEVRVVLGEQSKLFLNSAAAGSVEFTVGRIWREEP